MKKKNKWTRFRHKVTFKIMAPIFKVFLKAKYGYTYEPFKCEKGQNYLVLCNHACSMDPFFVGVAFKGVPLYYMSSDDLLKNKGAGFWINLLVRPIPKKKQLVDPKAIRTCLQIAKEKANICIFPEGNRTFSGEMTYIDPSISKLAKALKMNIVIFNIENGYGIDPRFSKSSRKGYIHGSIKKVISANDVASLSNEELYTQIKDNLSYEVDYTHEYQSDSRAEYLERVLYVCPKCHKLETLKTDKNDIMCSCGLKATYNANLTFSSNDESFKFNNVADWYKYQKQFIKEVDVSKKDIILSDENVTLKYALDKTNEVVMTGKVELHQDYFAIINEKETRKLYFNEFRGASVTGKHKVILFDKNDGNFTILGEERFNAYKYVQMMHKLLNKIEEFI